MASAVPNNKPVSLKVIAVLALVQSALGLLRAFHWFEAGSDLLGQGLLILPAIGLVALARGGLIAAIALLYVAFAVAAFTGQAWARPLGISAAVVNLLLVLSVVAQGELLIRALIWAVIPVIILWWLFSPVGREASRC
ncbi:MAG TPA: hypothetical protein VGK77_16900 [Candidatus Binatia bacterium]|jgi:hypothetical protein